MAVSQICDQLRYGVKLLQIFFLDFPRLHSFLLDSKFLGEPHGKQSIFSGLPHCHQVAAYSPSLVTGASSSPRADEGKNCVLLALSLSLFPYGSCASARLLPEDPSPGAAV